MNSFILVLPMAQIKKILLAKNGRKFYVRDASKDYHTQFGFIGKKDLAKKEGSAVSSNTGEAFTILKPQFIDIYRRIKRDAQIISLKDIGIIIAETGINKSSRALDAGSGSGALACFLAHLVKEMVTYEIRDDFIKIVEANKQFLNLKNLKIRKKDIYAEMDDKNLDLIILDVPEPWKALDSAKKGLKPGGFLVSYFPYIPQTIDFVNAVIQGSDFAHLKTVEIIEREWQIEERRVRPKTKGIGHTGFLSFARK